MMFYLIRILVVVAIVCLFIVISKKKEMEMEQIENMHRYYIFGCFIYASCFVSN